MTGNMKQFKTRVPRKQRVRRTILLISFMLFPITVFYFSPYLIIMGAAQGAVSFSFLLFSGMFVFSILFGRAFCGWVCPAGGLQECAAAGIDKPARGGKANLIKFILWVPWLAVIVLFFVKAGGIKTLDPFIGTDYGMSVTRPQAYIIYIPVLLLILIPALAAGKRSFCHYICWMAPFMILGRRLGQLVRIPSMGLKAEKDSCVNCGLCSRACPMSLDVQAMVQSQNMFSDECILCGECTDACNKKTISFVFKK